ncbi:MAG: TetR family transcriptional regulator [Sandaracinus sp.]|nr:TetR family transcriptional regulator [Sandaracinus sp.]
MPPLPRFEKLPLAKRRAILAAAAAEFAEHGFEAASFNRIIAAAGISKGAMYYYFADKADAYAAVLDDVFARMDEALGSLPEPTTADEFWSTVAAGTARLDETIFSDPQLAALARSLYRGGDTNPAHRHLMAASRSRVERILARGQAVGAVRKDLPQDLLAEATTGLLTAVDRWFVEALEDRPLIELLPLVPPLLGMARALLAPPEA